MAISTEAIVGKGTGSTDLTAVPVGIGVLGCVLMAIDTVSWVPNPSRLARLGRITDMQARLTHSPTILCGQCIQKIVRMPFRAVSFGSVLSANANASKYIDSSRHGFNVIGIHARRIAAEMVKTKTVWNWTFDKFVGKAVGKDNIGSIALESGAKRSIAFAIRRTLPKPTRCAVPERPVFIDLSPKTFNGGKRQCWYHGSMIPQLG